jgi:hypothetical protein
MINEGQNILGRTESVTSSYVRESPPTTERGEHDPRFSTRGNWGRDGESPKGSRKGVVGGFIEDLRLTAIYIIHVIHIAKEMLSAQNTDLGSAGNA